MMYAGDMQLYMTCDGDQLPTCMIEECVGEISNWMRTNMLALNDRKTEVIHFSRNFMSCDWPIPCNKFYGERAFQYLCHVFGSAYLSNHL